jgi:hypothetical protein
LYSADPSPIADDSTFLKLIGAAVYDADVLEDAGNIGDVVACYYNEDSNCPTIVITDAISDTTTAVELESGNFQDTVTLVANDRTEAFVPLTNLQEIPELGNNAPERIDVTVLSDAAKKSISGLIDTAQDLAFKFLYEKTQFETLSKMVGSHEWLVTLPDGTTATFTATPSVKLAGVAPSAALSYTLSLSVESEIVFA